MTVFFLYFQEVIHLLVLETNRYYSQFIQKKEVGSSPEPDIKYSEMCAFLAIVIQMGHDIRDSLKDYWARLEQFYTPFYGNAMACGRFLHILRFLHFTNNENEPNRNDESYDRLWKIRNLFDVLSEKYSKLYRPSEYLAVDEVIVLFEGRVIFKQYIPKKHKRFGIKICKLRDLAGYTVDTTVHLGQDRQNAAQDVTATRATVKTLPRRVEGRGHKLMMDNFFLLLNFSMT